MLEGHQRDLPYINQVMGWARDSETANKNALPTPMLSSPSDGCVIALRTTTKINFDPQLSSCRSKGAEPFISYTVLLWYRHVTLVTADGVLIGNRIC